jgi:hypothetical protein
MYKRKYIRLKRTEKQQKPAFWITARCYKGSDSFLVRVPGVMTSVPEVPEVVLVDDFVYRLA